MSSYIYVRTECNPNYLTSPPFPPFLLSAFPWGIACKHHCSGPVPVYCGTKTKTKQLEKETERDRERESEAKDRNRKYRHKHYQLVSIPDSKKKRNEKGPKNTTELRQDSKVSQRPDPDRRQERRSFVARQNITGVRELDPTQRKRKKSHPTRRQLISVLAV